MLNRSVVQQWLAALVGLTLGLVSGAVTAAPPPVEHFTRLPTIDSVEISPSGRRLAVLAFNKQGRRILTVMNLDPVSEPRLVGGFGDADIEWARWVNDDRLVYEASQPGAVVSDGGAGTFAVNHDGTESLQLIAWVYAMSETKTAIRSRILPYGWYLHSTVDDGSANVFVGRRVNDAGGDLKQRQLARLDTRTGLLTPLSQGFPDGVLNWWLDAAQEVRLVSSYVGGRTKIHWRRSGSDSWEQVADFDPLTEPGFTPWLIDRNGDILVTGRIASDASGVYRFDPVARRVDPAPLVGVAGFDLRPQAKRDGQTGQLVGIDFVAHQRMSYWFDEKIEAIQRGIDAALPAGRTNTLYCGRCESTRFFVIRSSSDRQPGEYFLFDRQKTSLQRLGLARPWIDEATQATRTYHRVKARDGLPLPVYVTHPHGAAKDKPLPTVMVVHGGPWVRGSNLGWDAEAQFLASRGYRVLEPEFRGSEGYGFRHSRAGWKEWGNAMQHDLADVVQWAAQQGLVDAARACLMGGSYGGYAALMAPIITPGVYQCAASFAGVTDIKLMYDITWSDTSADARRYGMPTLIGDPVKDAELLERASPLARVGELKIPILLAHGAADRRVPIDHAKKFVAAAQRAGATLDVVYYSGEGHGFFDPANHTDYLGRLEAFLAKALSAKR